MLLSALYRRAFRRRIRMDTSLLGVVILDEENQGDHVSKRIPVLNMLHSKVRQSVFILKTAGGKERLI